MSRELTHKGTPSEYGRCGVCSKLLINRLAGYRKERVFVLVCGECAALFKANNGVTLAEDTAGRFMHTNEPILLRTNK